MLVKSCLKFCMPGFSIMQTKNFQMSKLDLEKAETRDQIVNSCWIIEKIKRIPKNTSASLTTLKPLTVWIVPNWKILKEIEIPDHLTCLLRNLYAGQESTVRTVHGTIDWFKIGKGACILCIKPVYCHPAHLTYMQST